jgi:hypothetical protein
MSMSAAISGGGRPFQLSSGLPFAGLIFYGASEFVACELSNSIKIKGLAVGQNLWRAV